MLGAFYGEQGFIKVYFYVRIHLTKVYLEGMMQKAVFFDIDGTLRDLATSVVPASARSALKQLRENGYFLGIATGRAMCEISDDIMRLIDWDAYCCFNGQVLYSKQLEKIYKQSFPVEISRQILQISSLNDLRILYIPEDGEPLLNSEPDECTKGVYKLLDMQLPKVKPYDDEHVIAFMVIGDKEKDFTVLEAINGVSLYKGVGDYADVVMQGTSKYSGIKRIMELYKLDEYIAFGDSLNDYEMLENASISVAVGECEKSISEIADVKAPGVMDDGVFKTCVKLGLI